MNLFTYGTLMFDDIWQLVVGRAVDSQPALLSGYEVRCVVGDLYPVMFAAHAATERDVSETIAGLVYFDLTEPEIDRLDRYESNLYDRVRVTPTLVDGSQVECRAYVLRESNRHIASETRWTAAWFEKHAKADYMMRLRG